MELATGEGDPRGLVDDHVLLWHHWEIQCHPWRLRIYRRNVRTQSSYVKNLFAYRIWSPFAYSMMLILSVFVTRCVSRQRFENKNVTILVTMTTSQVCKLRALLSASRSGTVQELGGREGARLLLPRSTSWGRAGAAPGSQCVPAVSGGALHSVIIHCQCPHHLCIFQQVRWTPKRSKELEEFYLRAPVVELAQLFQILGLSSLFVLAFRIVRPYHSHWY